MRATLRGSERERERERGRERGSTSIRLMPMECLASAEKRWSSMCVHAAPQETCKLVKSGHWSNYKASMCIHAAPQGGRCERHMFVRRQRMQRDSSAARGPFASHHSSQLSRVKGPGFKVSGSVCKMQGWRHIFVRRWRTGVPRSSETASPWEPTVDMSRTIWWSWGGGGFL